MQNINTVADKMRGVYIADTVFLPEKTVLDADTVILTRRLLFQGQNPTIKGNHNIALFVSETTGALGTTLQQALGGRRPTFVQAGWKHSYSVSALAALNPLRGGTLTVDVSGRGRADWLKQARGKSPEFLPASFQTEGADGRDGDPGTNGISGGS